MTGLTPGRPAVDDPATAHVEVLLPAVLADLAGGDRRIVVACPPGDLTVADALDRVAAVHPVLGRRLRDEQGRQRRYVNLYVDGVDVRALAGLATPLHPGAVLQVLPSVAGG